MKLRNKNTGDPVKFVSIESIYKDKLKLTYILSSGLINERYYTSIEKFNEDWEDYVPKEPLIKDEKIRKAVRAWAEANEREYLLVIKSGGRLEISDGSPHLIYISFHVDNDTLKILDDRTYYPIGELCGEEEE